MKTKTKFPITKGKNREKKYNGSIHLNTSFEDAIKVVVGAKKPTKNMLKEK